MKFQKVYVVLLKKGPTWSADTTPELESLQANHLAYIDSIQRAGKLKVAGPVDDHSDDGIRGISIFREDAFSSPDELKDLVEKDPAFQAGRLSANYLTWHFPDGSSLI